MQVQIQFKQPAKVRLIQSEIRALQTAQAICEQLALVANESDAHVAALAAEHLAELLKSLVISH